eukprot:TRINITY_DN17337_c0_g1_i1.p1 TRINITY_DN17337_c0_g1~~TRINITY_DN17337_c0_g1_i1.p1  ORF type:complete len:200 (+),score=70.31 TRINITY_DN17337_c0_g1_i1:76-675(+)
MPAMIFHTALGTINFVMREDAAPRTVQHIKRIVEGGMYDGCCFYRSDFVIQCGLMTPDGRQKKSPYGDLKINETRVGTQLSNLRGTMSVAHWDPPDCGNSDIFINLKNNAYLDRNGGGFCVFAEVVGAESLKVCDAIAKHVAGGQKALIKRAVMGITPAERAIAAAKSGVKRKHAGDDRPARPPPPAADEDSDASTAEA